MFYLSNYPKPVLRHELLKFALMLSCAVLTSFLSPCPYTRRRLTMGLNGPYVIVTITPFVLFVPTTPNPTSGFLLFCPRKDVIFMDMSVEDAVKLVVSGGIVTPPDYGKPVAKGASTAGKRPASRKAPAKKSAGKAARKTS